ncbi:MAG: FUSC family protein [Gaiellaceae bacterium]
MTLAGTLAWWAASALGAHKPLFAVLVPLVTMTGDPFSVVSVSFDRILGVFAGVGIGIGLVHASLPGTVTVAIALAAGTAAGLGLRTSGRPNTQTAVSALFMLAVAGSSQAGVARVWETAIGAAIAIAVAALVWPPDPVRELTGRLERLRQQLALDLTAVADELATGSGASTEHLDELRTRSVEAIRDFFEVDPAKHALRLSPLRRRDRAEVLDLDRRLELAARLYRHTRAIARDVADMRTRSTALAEATRHVAAAADLALAGRDAGGAVARAERALERTDEPFLALQLNQLLADLRARLHRVPEDV